MVLHINITFYTLILEKNINKWQLYTTFQLFHSLLNINYKILKFYRLKLNISYNFIKLWIKNGFRVD